MKTPNGGISVGRTAFIPPIDFTESMTRSCSAWGGPTPSLKHLVVAFSFNRYMICSLFAVVSQNKPSYILNGS